MTKKERERFFNRPADTVARELLGCVLCVKQKDGKIARHSITETEAYMGPHDLACHAAKGHTKRTEVMFAEAGTIYVYLIYGMYEMLNIVAGAKDYPAAVLIRGAGEHDGPGKLTKALSITREHNTRPLGKSTGVWIEKGAVPSKVDIQTAPRVGIGYAGAWAKKKLRFIKKP